MKFRVEIELGNDAMQSNHDIAKALRQVAKEISHQHQILHDAPREFRIRDTNGNAVGRYRSGR
jgi:hypothetical protein